MSELMTPIPFRELMTINSDIVILRRKNYV